MIEVEGLTDQGETERRDGNLENARHNFEAALDLLWDFSRAHAHKTAAIEGEIDDLVVLLQGLNGAEEIERAAIDNLTEREGRIAVADRSLGERAQSQIGASHSDLPIQLHDRVLSFLEYFTKGKGRRTIEVGLTRAGLYGPMIRRIFREEGIPEDLIYLAQAESTFKPHALSRASAKGMWQFIASRGREYGLRQTWWIDERSDPEKSTRAAARHLRDLHNQFGHWYLAMAAYNAGPARVERAVQQAGTADFWVLAEKLLLPRETRNYVPTILAMTLIGRNPSGYGFDVRPAAPLEVERVRVDQVTDLRIIAEGLELPLESIQELNPHVLRWATPPDDAGFELILPAGYSDLYAKKIRPLGQMDRIRFQYHVVSRGETLSHLSRRYGVSSSAIRETNRLSNPNVIRPGQPLIIPPGGDPVPGALMAEISSTKQSPPEVYRVRRGDTLWQIGETFDLAIGDLKAWNGLTSDLLTPSDTLRLTPPEGWSVAPAPVSSKTLDRVVYNVQSGDTLSRIALAYRTSVDAIRIWNLELDLSIIRPGDQIKIYCTAAVFC